MTLRYPRLLALQLRVSLTTAMQYRADFFVEGLMSVYWLGWNLLPLFILYGDRTSVAGWDFPSALVVIGWFVVLRGILEGAINPSLVDIVERIRTGAEWAADNPQTWYAPGPEGYIDYPALVPA